MLTPINIIKPIKIIINITGKRDINSIEIR